MKTHFSKPPLSTEEQVNLLQSRGLEVNDVNRARRYLSSIGYYRFSAYCIPFRNPLELEFRFRKNTSFDDILSLYIFDRKLRCLFMEALERIEIHIRAQWVDHLTKLKQDPFAHLDKDNFLNVRSYQIDLGRLESNVERSKDENFIKHFAEHYEEDLPPLWACVQLMSFGELIHWIQNTRDKGVKCEIAKSLGFPKFYLFDSVSVALTELRNVCAHHVRLWNRSFMKKPKTIKKLLVPGFEEILPLNSGNKIFIFSIVIVAMLRHHNPNTTLPARLKNLLKTRPDWQIKSMGFPEDWEKLTVLK